MGRRVVVFGGSGFIGSYLIDELLTRGYDPISADIRSSEYTRTDYFVECDIMDSDAVSQVISKADIVYNCAGYANLDDAIKEPIKTMELNVLGNLNILEACRNHSIKRFVYASSAYAMNIKGSFYGISKLTSEKLTEEYHAQFGLDYTIIRYGSVYGERGFYNNYIYNLVKTAMATGEINHNGDGEEIREYIHAADVAKLSVDIIDSDSFIQEHIILTGAERMQRKELFNMINEMLGGEIKINITNGGYGSHYKTTPYAFQPEKSKKFTANPYIDMGQGILECMNEISKRSREK